MSADANEADDVVTPPLDQLESPDLDEQDVEHIEEPDPNPEPVTYSGTDFDVEGLVRRLDRGDIVVPTFGHQDTTITLSGFQRGFVWRRSQMDRFIESLLLGYPIPGIFLVQQADKRYLVLDGQQRLQTLADFYKGIHRGKEFALTNVADRFKDLTYEQLSEEQRRALDNTFIQAMIVKTDGTPASLDAVYQIFERLNAGGTQLTPHEIRVALYAGPFIDFLSELNVLPDWRALYGAPSPRIRDQEIILRFIALYVSPGNYRRPLKKYLNDFVAAHRYLDDLPVDTIRTRFKEATKLLLAGPGDASLRGAGRQVNAALSEAVLVGLARRLDAGSAPKANDVASAFASLLADKALQGAIGRATADEESVRTRLAKSTQAFAQI